MATILSISTIAYFFIGYSLAYGMNFFDSATVISEKSAFELVKFFFLLTFAAAIPAIISGGIAERACFKPQLIASFVIVGFKCCGGQLVHSNHSHTALGDGLEYPERLQVPASTSFVPCQ